MESFLSGRNFGGSDKTVPSREQSSQFQPLFAPSVAAAPASNEDIHCDASAEPQIEVVNGKDGIERIIVICTCGKRIEVKCEYE